MSVLVADRKQSRLEVDIFSQAIRKDLLNFMERNFGIKQDRLKRAVEIAYARGSVATDDSFVFQAKLNTHKAKLNELSLMLISNIRAANAIYPTNMTEYESRRDYQTRALVNCEQIKGHFQTIIEDFEKFGIDINCFGPYIKSINREIGLIKKWRQRDNRYKSYL